MPVKVEDALSPSVISNQTDGTLAHAIFRFTGFQALTVEATFPQSVFKKIRASAIIFPGRVLSGYSNELG
jgi:hypothetical protein